MAKVIVTKSKLDALNSAVSAKAGTQTTRTVDGMTSAVSSLVALSPHIEGTQMNAAVSAFLSEVTYDPADTSTSSISGYVNSVSGYDGSKPKGLEVPLPGPGYIVIADRSEEHTV